MSVTGKVRCMKVQMFMCAHFVFSPTCVVSNMRKPDEVPGCVSGGSGSSPQLLQKKKVKIASEIH